MPLPIIILLAVWGTLNVIGTFLFVIDATNGLVVPEKRYEGRYAFWFFLHAITYFFFLGWGHVVWRIIRLVKK